MTEPDESVSTLFRTVEKRTRGLLDPSQAARRITDALVAKMKPEDIDRQDAADSKWLRRQIEAMAVQALGTDLVEELEFQLVQKIMPLMVTHDLARAKKSASMLVTTWGKPGHSRLLELADRSTSQDWLSYEVAKIDPHHVSGDAAKSTSPHKRAHKEKDGGMPDAQEGSCKRQAPAASSSTLGACHLLIKFSGSRNPVSRRTGQSTDAVTAEQAVAEIREFEQAIKAAGGTEEAFRDAARRRSDCKSFERGGDLGSFQYGKMQRAFSEATSNTAVGAMSEIVLSDSGYHLIWRYA